MYHALYNGRSAYKQGGLSAALDPPSLELRFTHEHLPADREQKIPKKWILILHFRIFKVLLIQHYHSLLMIYIHSSLLFVLDLRLLIVSCICGAYFSLPRSRVMNGREPHPWWPHRVLVLWIKGTLFWGLSLLDSPFWYHLFPVRSLNSLFAFCPHHLIWMWWYSQVGWSPCLSGHKGSEWKNNHSAALLAMM